MYHNTTYEINKNNKELFTFCDNITNGVKNMKNTVNYYIRNTMTGVQKEDDKRTPNEQEVLEIISGNIDKVNEIRKKPKHERNFSKGRKQETQKPEGKSKKKLKLLEMPTKDKWLLSYAMLDGVFKLTDNSAYRAIPANVAQCAIMEVLSSWKGYFAALKEYNKNPSKFSGKPKFPGYIRKDHSTAIISNQLARIRDGVLYLPGRHVMDISGYVPEGKLIEVRITPYYNGYVIHVIVDDESETSFMSNDCGVMMIDTGLNNFAAVCDNQGGIPFIIKGGFMKAKNQEFNKRFAKLKSELMKGHDPETYHPPRTKMMNSLSRNRNNFFNDCFYKISHRIAREATERNCGKIVIGKNDRMKDGIRLGHINNQNFVQIPFARFIAVLKNVCLKYGIEVIEQEESYTSKASAIDNDFIPTYGKSQGNHKFSGSRVKRGLYRTKSGIRFNADVNGSMNIGRKYDSSIFSGITDFSTFTEKIEVLNFSDFYQKKKKRNKSSPCKAG